MLSFTARLRFGAGINPDFELADSSHGAVSTSIIPIKEGALSGQSVASLGIDIHLPDVLGFRHCRWFDSLSRKRRRTVSLTHTRATFSALEKIDAAMVAIRKAEAEEAAAVLAAKAGQRTPATEAWQRAEGALRRAAAAKALAESTKERAAFR
jgi:hypothetical protein